MGLDQVPIITSLIAQRIVVAPSQVRPPSARGGAVSLRRYREGQLLLEDLPRELLEDGYAQGDVARLVHQAQLERAYDDYTDRLTALYEAYRAEALTDDELLVQLLALVPDQAKARLLWEIQVLRRRPKPRPVTEPQARELTLAQVLAAFRAGLIGRPQLQAELLRRQYSPGDVEVLIALEIARAPAPRAAAQRDLTLAELRAMLGLGIISAEEFLTELRRRGYDELEAQQLLGLEIARAQARALPAEASAQGQLELPPAPSP